MMMNSIYTSMSTEAFAAMAKKRLNEYHYVVQYVIINIFSCECLEVNNFNSFCQTVMYSGL